MTEIFSSLVVGSLSLLWFAIGLSALAWLLPKGVRQVLLCTVGSHAWLANDFHDEKSNRSYNMCACCQKKVFLRHRQDP